MVNPFSQMMNIRNAIQNQPKFDKEQFVKFMGNITPNALDPLIEQARKRGISESDIEKGKKIILSLMK